MGWLQSVGSIKLKVSFAKEPYKRDCIQQKRPIIDIQIYILWYTDMGWLQSVGSIKLKVSFAKVPYKRDCILQKRPIIESILLTVATPYTFCDMQIYILWYTDIHFAMYRYTFCDIHIYKYTFCDIQKWKVGSIKLQVSFAKEPYKETYNWIDPTEGCACTGLHCVTNMSLLMKCVSFFTKYTSLFSRNTRLYIRHSWWIVCRFSRNTRLFWQNGGLFWWTKVQRIEVLQRVAVCCSVLLCIRLAQACGVWYIRLSRWNIYLLYTKFISFLRECRFFLMRRSWKNTRLRLHRPVVCDYTSLWMKRMSLFTKNMSLLTEYKSILNVHVCDTYTYIYIHL